VFPRRADSAARESIRMDPTVRPSVRPSVRPAREFYERARNDQRRKLFAYGQGYKTVVVLAYLAANQVRFYVLSANRARLAAPS